jgi:hypothetical protein
MTQLVRSAKARRGRGVGYCANARCPEFLHLRPQLKAPEKYRCPVCAVTGQLELERGVRSGEGTVVSEVRVEYGFDPRRSVYRERVALRAARAPRAVGVFTLQTPLISDAGAAGRLGAALLRQLSRPEHWGRPRRAEPEALLGRPDCSSLR